MADMLPTPVTDSTPVIVDDEEGHQDGKAKGEEESKGWRRGLLPFWKRKEKRMTAVEAAAKENIRSFLEGLEDPYVKRMEEEKDREFYLQDELFDFPDDPEHWAVRDLEEHWVEAPASMTKPGWDPVFADMDDWKAARAAVRSGRDPAIFPYYVPYHGFYPVIPGAEFDPDVPDAKSAIEELDRIEEFLTWVSYIFPDGGSYEGTVWDDLAYGKGVYVADKGLVRYEGEWFLNAMDGHGVAEVEIPGVQPVPSSKLEAWMRAKGKIVKRDYMSPEDQKWLDMDIEDSIHVTAGHRVTPFYEKRIWVKFFGKKPEKGRYKYAGQWKHGHMHGCGVYEVNERIQYGRFYFGEYFNDSSGCDADVSMTHAGIAEIAAAKARMFVNKPDGMVREKSGPYGDPQHVYMYDEEDVWMAPGFIHEFYEAPDYWKTYVEEVDQERLMWLNSFYKSPLRIPMPAELEYWWEKDESPEFILINQQPEPDPEDPSKLIYNEDPLIYHTRTGRIINYVDDDEHGVRLFWQPPLEEGEDVQKVDPEKVEFLPLGFDEFYSNTIMLKKGSWFIRVMKSLENVINPILERLEKWIDEKEKAREMNLKLIEQELELVEAEICLEEEMEDLELELKKQKEEEKREAARKDLEEVSMLTGSDNDKFGELTGRDEVEFGGGGGGEEEEEEVEEEEEDEGEQAPSSFGAILSRDENQESGDDKKGKNSFPFSSLSLPLGMYPGPTLVPTKLKDSFTSWKTIKQSMTTKLPCSSCSNKHSTDHDAQSISCVHPVSYPQKLAGHARLRAVLKEPWRPRKKVHYYDNVQSQLNGLAKILLAPHGHRGSKLDNSKPSFSNIPPELGVGIFPLTLQSLHQPSDSLKFCTIGKYQENSLIASVISPGFHPVS